MRKRKSQKPLQTVLIVLQASKAYLPNYHCYLEKKSLDLATFSSFNFSRLTMLDGKTQETHIRLCLKHSLNKTHMHKQKHWLIFSYSHMSVQNLPVGKKGFSCYTASFIAESAAFW